MPAWPETAVHLGMHHQAHQAHKAIPPTLDRIARHVVDAGLKVHRALGPGLLESAYEACLAYERLQRDLAVQRQVALPVVYDGVELDAGYRLDLLVDGEVVVEVKSVEALSRLHEAQILTYLKLSHRRLGFLMNFNTLMFKDGVRRIAL